MTVPWAKHEGIISEWLAAAGARKIGHGHWALTLKHEGIAASAVIEEDTWLALRLPLVDARAGTDSWSLLKRNADLAGLCKFALDPGHGTRQLRAEMPLDPESKFVTLPRRISETLECFAGALKDRQGPAEGRDKDSAPESEKEQEACEPEERIKLADLLNEAGWQFVERSPLKAAVDLEVRAGFAQAVIESQNGRGILASVETAKFDTLSGKQRLALGNFLLAVCGAIRMVRASFVEAETSALARFEVRLTAPKPFELGHALTALSVAMNFCGREAQCFANEQVAEVYLAANKQACIQKVQ